MAINTNNYLKSNKKIAEILVNLAIIYGEL